ncbi:hypothetical protein J595_02337 [Acinetobacter sp. 1592897]|nr:hypothetical protein J514_1054 [Acinetobacter sp. 1396970]EXF01808.1 hypothetical protein J594_0108 [Acinetobacter sp. 259052]EXH79218.1 hypothetical protein J633_0042 [Acinetobacter sp. 216872]EXS48318.1 hypothetical protein J660_0199 [Acinetobacter sp. 88816]EYT16146.1 hypothetical protein J595_02337 [Acinetobacter sp. 1592897]KCX92500.1 hypothetical protein J568_2489 [Acinetobacter baumannii 6112]
MSFTITLSLPLPFCTLWLIIFIHFSMYFYPLIKISENLMELSSNFSNVCSGKYAKFCL